MAKPKKHLEYRVAWTINKAQSSHSLELALPTLDEAMELARDQYVSAVTKGHEIAIRVVTPAGNTFCDWARWNEPGVPLGE